MEVRGNHLPLPLPATAGAVGGGQGGAALLAVPGDVPVLAGAAHAHREDAGGVPVTVAVVLELAPVAAGPDVDTAPAPPTLRHSLLYRPSGERPGTVHRLAVVR